MNWHEYPQWKPQSLSTAVPNLDIDGLDLLAVSFYIDIRTLITLLRRAKS